MKKEKYENVQIGQKFGKLTIEKFIENPLKRSGGSFKCLCDCGKQIILNRCRVVGGYNKSCGCLQSKTIDNIGITFNRLTIQSVFRKNDKTYVKCLCDCGKYMTAIHNAVVGGHTKSCGCVRKNKRGPKTELGESLKKCLIKLYIKGAQKRNIVFELTEDEIEKLFKQDCHYCNCQPRKQTKSQMYGEYYANGIDRVDNTKGYTKENSVTCCKECNFMKRSMSKDMFIKKCIDISKNHNG
jgi:hypothetical protein